MAKARRKPEPEAPQTKTPPRAHLRLTLAACILASSVVFIDGTVLTVALPALRKDLAADYALLQWVMNGYVLALAALTLIGGALSDRYGHAKVLAAGCLLFALASAGCALAPDIGWLIATRVLQGIAAALVAPSSLALIGSAFPRSERSAAIGVWAAASALAAGIAPVIGGWLTENLGWRWIFWINPPFGIAAILLLTFAPASKLDKRRFDLPGAFLLALALAAIAYALGQIGPGEGTKEIEAPRAPLSVIVSAAVAGLVLLGIYAWWQRTTDHPLTPPRLLRNKPFLGLNLATLGIYGALSVGFFLLPFDMIDRRNLSATDVGLIFVPFTLAIGLLSRYFGRLADAYGARLPLIIGPLGCAAAYVWLAAGQQLPVWLGIFAPVCLMGLSMSILVAPLTSAVMSSVKDADEGLASGVNNAASRIASLLGVALAAGLATFAASYTLGMVAAAIMAALGALAAAVTLKR
ncbi:MAG: MFS transporter [Xanthobacteraceae bacterium]|nr:MFS transporter [Xanthobacteraceae bacterium]QYK46081.1 MAG: MFS transporter [Xanthobacteraceae bacterium]